MNFLLNIAFTCELSLRMVAFGVRKLFQEDFGGYSLDAFCVFGSIIELLAVFFSVVRGRGLSTADGPGRLQVLRMLRVFRSTRILKLVSPLRILVVQIGSALRSV